MTQYDDQQQLIERQQIEIRRLHAQLDEREQLLATAENHARACDEQRRAQQQTIAELRAALAAAQVRIIP